MSTLEEDEIRQRRLGGGISGKEEKEGTRGRRRRRGGRGEREGEKSSEQHQMKINHIVYNFVVCHLHYKHDDNSTPS